MSPWIQISCRNLMQQRCKQSEVSVADQRHFYVSMTGDGFVQVFCCVKAGEASTSNNDLFLDTST